MAPFARSSLPLTTFLLCLLAGLGAHAHTDASTGGQSGCGSTVAQK